MFHTRRLSLVVGVGFAALLCGASPSLAQIALGTAQSFGVLGASTVTNTGASVITGNLGVSPGTAVVGFPPGSVTGTIYSGPGVAAQAQIDLTTAYVAITNTTALVNLTGKDLGGLTLIPGVYSFDSSAQLTGTLTLNAQNNPNAVFIFKIGSTLTTASSSSVGFINVPAGIDLSCNVFWQVGSSATLGTTTSFAGNILAMASITLDTGASVSGRLLARTGAVTLDGSNVTVCPPIPAPPLCPIITLTPPPTPPNLPPGVVLTPYVGQTFTASGGTTPYTIALSSGALPPGLTLTSSGPSTALLSGTPTAVGTFIFTITATDANGCFIIQPYTIVIAAPPPCPPITLSPPPLPAGVRLTPGYSATVAVISGGTAPYSYDISSGALPGGLLGNTVTGAITGTPTTAGLFNFTITAWDAHVPPCSGSQAYSILISPCPVITVSPPTLPGAEVGTAYPSTTFTATGGTGSYTYASAPLVPVPGLTLTAGVLSGTPTTAGVFSFVITATDENGCTGLLGYTVTILSRPIPTLSEWGVIIFVGLVGLVGLMSIYYLRRKRREA
jgi:hypothetical protein